VADRPDRSPLEGLGSPRRGSHRPGGSHTGGLIASLVAVLAVIALLVGLYTAFGRPGDGSTVSDGSTGSPATAGASSAATSGAPSAAALPSGSAAAQSGATSSSATAAASGTSTAPASQVPAASGTASSSATGSVAPGAIGSLPVVVLNQSRVAGRAARTADQLRSRGWQVTSIGNFHGSVPSTTIYYPAGGLAAAQALATQLPGADRLRPAFSGVSQRALTVVLV